MGNINKVRWLGYEYDESIGGYFIEDRWYNPSLQTYMDGEDNSFAYVEINPFIEFEEDGIMVIDAYDNDILAEQWSNALLEDSSYGKALSYSKTWYSNLASVEMLARCIYCEGGTAYTQEEDAVAWIILNRVKSSKFAGNNPRDIITQNGQFASITGGSASTKDARQPDTKSLKWKNSTYLACFMLTTMNELEWKTIIRNPIQGQLHFYSYTTAKKKGVPFSGTNSDALYYNTSRIQNVYVLGYGNVSSFPTLFNNYNPIDYSRNIYYDYK